MTQETILAVGQRAILMMLLLGGPILMASLVVGLLVSVFQAVTQINEQTLTFVPKIIAVLAILVVMGPWMLQLFTAYTAGIFTTVATLAR